jgi:hypothetical protein
MTPPGYDTPKAKHNPKSNQQQCWPTARREEQGQGGEEEKEQGEGKNGLKDKEMRRRGRRRRITTKNEFS